MIPRSGAKVSLQKGEDDEQGKAGMAIEALWCGRVPGGFR